MPRRTPKKSAMLEVRLPQEVKDALMARCQAENQSASEIVRAGIEAFLARSSTTKEVAVPKSRVPWMLAASAGAVAVGVFLATPGAAAPDLRAAFGQLDANGDGAVTQAEFAAANQAEPLVIGLSATAASMPSGASSNAPALSEMTRAVRVPAPASAPEAAQVSMTPVPLDQDVTRQLLEDEFGRMDADDDRQVLLPEFIAAREATIRAAFASTDANSDGWLTVDEIAGQSDESGALRAAAPDAIIRRYDQNNDGRLSYAEFAS